MILRGMGRLIGAGVTLVAVAAALASGWARLDTMADQGALKNTSLTTIRQQALEMFPRGSRLDDAATHLAGIGFECQSMTHFLADTSAPSLLCASNGRGYPDFPGINVTLVTRNGLIADIDVWNVMARADGEPDEMDMTATGSISSSKKAGDGSAALEP